MDPHTQLPRLIAAGAWLQEHTEAGFGPKIALGAAEWIEGRGLLFAELGAEHQGHVHLIEAGRLDLDGDMVDAYGADGGLVATVHAMASAEAEKTNIAGWIGATQGGAWRRFWADAVAVTTATE